MSLPDETKIQHESFGFIRASRVSGHTPLFDSAVRHQHYVTVTVGRAEQARRYSDSYVQGREELITVAMSESQFAQFITSMNVGSGSPCTLTRVGNQRVEPPPADINTRETFETEVKQAAVQVGEDLKDGVRLLKGLLANGKANKGDLAALLSQMEKVERELIQNMPFMMKQFAEGIEKLTDRAKMDLNAHATMLGQRMLLADQTAPSLQLTAETKEG